MLHNYELKRAELEQKLLSLAEKKLSQEALILFAKFIPHFLSSVDAHELQNRNIDDLCGTLMYQWNLLYNRKPGEKKLKIFNPTLANDNWHSKHTVIVLVQEDMPFLVDSILMEINRHQLTCHIIFHAGGMGVKRDKNNDLIDIYPRGTQQEAEQLEAVIYVEIEQQIEPSVLSELHQNIQHVLNDVELAVEDWHKMTDKVKETQTLITSESTYIDKEEIDITREFLDWLLNDNFIFLGYREYSFEEHDNEGTLTAIQGTGLGVLKNISGKQSRQFSSMPSKAQQIALSAHLLIIAKSNIVSTVHRRGHVDIVGIKVFDKSGKVIGERRFVGLYTSVAYNSRPYSIPLLREKVHNVIAQSNFSPDGHGGKALLHILETLPRDDLLQSSVTELLELSHRILYMQERQDIRLVIRKDVYGRFLSCLVYVPKERYNTYLRQKMQDILVDEFDAKQISYNASVTDASLARIHFMVWVEPQSELKFDEQVIEEKLAMAARTWQDNLLAAITLHFDESQAKKLGHYAEAFPAGYRENHNIQAAINDIELLETLNSPLSLAMRLIECDNQPHCLGFKLYRLNKPVPLSESLPMLENMGLFILSEEPYRITLGKNHYAWINEFQMDLPSDLYVDFPTIKPLFQEAFASSWFKQTENDGFNRLVLTAKLSWQEIVILRAYAKYLKQLGFTFSQNYIEATLSKHAYISSMLITLFKTKFDPNTDLAQSREEIITQQEQKIINALDDVVNSEEDKILNRFLELIRATLRTSFFLRPLDGQQQSYLSFKINPALITDMPLPRPMIEAWVYSPRVEGVHLRSLKVARGGLRWSDRREDFRTEILGLMKAQKVKNAVIVPSGAKGGFVCKSLPTDGNRDEVMQEGVACYRTFIRGILDLSDNLIDGKVVTPAKIVRYDDDDAYLVVAADKGTATFSNFANEISAEYSFWLDDAFASGGSTGYDHKKIGITARGAWESAKRHFRELGVDIQKQDFTVIGIGDLGGDVFGNGMLCSRHTKLLAAFNHLHIFIDPNPDPELSFVERERMFYLPRSTWEDYNPELISQGGGVFKRSAKLLTLSPEIQKLFNIKKTRVEPNELIRAILSAKVDMLWNGGIGTFVKSSNENHDQAGDKFNDFIRLNGKDLQCKVVVEGGNLGFTQLGRIEYALNGGSIFTDFIDNSAGVDCSDHEVNIKILLNHVVNQGELNVKQRNDLLASMTEEVAHLVLRNNYMQTQALTIAQRQVPRTFDLYARFIREMEQQGKLDRQLEFLPDDKQLQERKGTQQTLTAPELAILMAYSKIHLKEEIIASTITQDEYLVNTIITAFPRVISKKYRQYMLTHPLRQEIIATQMSNLIINYMGVTFISRMKEESGAPVNAIVQALTVAQEVFDARKIWHQIELLDNKVTTDIQFEMIRSITRLLRRATRWFLRVHRNDLNQIADLVTLYRSELIKLSVIVPDLLLGTAKQYYDDFTLKLQTHKVPPIITRKIAISLSFISGLDIIAACREHNFLPEYTAKIYFQLGGLLQLGWLRQSVVRQKEENYWDALGKAALRDDIDWQQRELTVAIIAGAKNYKDTEKTIEDWMSCHRDIIERWNSMLLELKGANIINFAMYIVIIQELVELTQASKQYNKIKKNSDEKSESL